jgi:hypothetical protein
MLQYQCPVELLSPVLCDIGLLVKKIIHSHDFPACGATLTTAQSRPGIIRRVEKRTKRGKKRSWRYQSA